MRCAAVIAEYNPFHNGHAFQIRKTKEEGGADYVIALMSPDFVQRGMPAFADKYTRTGMALEGGADLVLEMPVRTAVSSAGDFASGSVKILNALGCIDLISFGSESGDLGALTRIADLLSSETPLFKDILTSSLKEGATYAAARQRSLAALLTGKQQLSGNDPADLMGSPNNILALEYLNALIRTGSAITPFTVRRIGEGYHSLEGSISDEYPSAEGIRRRYCEEGICSAARAIPSASFEILQRDLEIYGSWDPSKYDILLHYALLSTDPGSIMDASDEIAARIRSLRNSYTDASGFADIVKTKQYTLTRIRRVLLHIFLGLEKEAPCPEASYVRVLGFRRSAAALLKALKNNTSIPLITKPASAGRLLSDEAFSGFNEDVRCSSLYRLLQAKNKRENEYTRSPIILDDLTSFSS